MSHSKLSTEAQAPTTLSTVADIFGDLAGSSAGREYVQTMARMLISRLEERGYAIVPLEPTAEIIDAMQAYTDESPGLAAGCYNTMLAARPR